MRSFAETMACHQKCSSSERMLYADWTASVTIDICCSTAMRASFSRSVAKLLAFKYSANASRIPVKVENS